MEVMCGSPHAYEVNRTRTLSLGKAEGWGFLRALTCVSHSNTSKQVSIGAKVASRPDAPCLTLSHESRG